MKIVKKIQMKIVIFTAVKNRCMLHGPVFVMKAWCRQNLSKGILIFKKQGVCFEKASFCLTHPELKLGHLSVFFLLDPHVQFKGGNSGVVFNCACYLFSVYSIYLALVV